MLFRSRANRRFPHAALAQAGTIDPSVLLVDVLLGMRSARRARVLRRWIETLALPPLPAQGTARIESDLIDAAPDSDAAFVWSGAVVRRWRGILHADLHAALQPALLIYFSIATLVCFAIAWGWAIWKCPREIGRASCRERVFVGV